MEAPRNMQDDKVYYYYACIDDKMKIFVLEDSNTKF